MDWDEKADGPPPPLPEGCMLPSADGDKPWRAVMSTPVAQLLDGEAAAALPGEPPGEPVQRLFERLGTGQCAAPWTVQLLSRLGLHGNNT